MKHDLFHSYSFTLFGIQGLVGAAFGSIFQNSAVFSTQTIVLGCIAAGLGIGFGLAI
jgi:ABC-type molybdate transport system permease subunit